MGLQNAQRFFGRVGKVDGLEIQLINLDNTDAVTAQLRAEFGSSYRVSNWMEFNEAAAAGFEMLKRVYALVLLMLIGVAAFNLVANADHGGDGEAQRYRRTDVDGSDAGGSAADIRA